MRKGHPRIAKHFHYPEDDKRRNAPVGKRKRISFRKSLIAVNASVPALVENDCRIDIVEHSMSQRPLSEINRMFLIPKAERLKPLVSRGFQNKRASIIESKACK